MDDALADRFRSHLETSGLLAGPGRALLAVSGGADSMALLDLCAGAAAARGITLLLAHADHGIQDGSGKVAATVRQAARDAYGLETVIGRLDLGPDAGETRARIARYRFLRAVQDDRQARWLVTAHHADDQAETVLLRILRGSGPVGLAGMTPVGPRGLVRPLLPFRRAELAGHAAARGLPVFDDPANADPRHTRSWLRTALLPVLAERLGDRAFEALLSVSRHAAADVAAWDALLDVLPGLDVRIEADRADVARAALAGYDAVLAASVIRAAARRAGLMLGPAQAERVVRLAAAASGRTLDLGEGCTAAIAFERLIVGRMQGPPAESEIRSEAGERRVGRFTVRWRAEPAPDGRIGRGGWTTWLTPGSLTVRAPARGDRVVPLGGVGHRAVTRLLMEGRVPRGDRAAWPVVVRDGSVVWVPGICRGRDAVPDPGTLAVRMDVAPAG